uniref:V-type proton ATPase subunit S1-like n=1 Tax=Hirondellea gigas TaxID=1518452 RepID=A0A2P2HZK2_9CRUS
MMWSWSGILLILAIANNVFCDANVPVLIWNSHRTEKLNMPAVSALQQISVESLQARYFDAFQPNNVLLFLQDALSIEDLSSHLSELKHVKARMQAGQSLYLPNVQQPAQLQHNLVQQGYKVSKLSAGSGVAELQLDHTANNLVVVKLPPTITNPSRSRALRKADEVMQSVLSKIGGAAKFTVIYTALKNTVEESKEQHGSGAMDRVRVARSLKEQIGILEEEQLPSNFHDGKCIYIYFRNYMNISVTGSKGPFSAIPENTNVEALNECPDNGSTQSIQLNYNNVTMTDTTYYKLKIGFFFERKGSYWRSPHAEVILFKDRSSKPDKRDLRLINWKDESVPVGKSYSCTPTLIYRETGNSTNTTNIVELRINGVQVQAFIPKDSLVQFGPSWDCVGFFTIGIWSGLFAAFLSVFIIGVGFSFLADIKTMDRFDDPKGKSIVVAQLD